MRQQNKQAALTCAPGLSATIMYVERNVSPKLKVFYVISRDTAVV